MAEDTFKDIEGTKEMWDKRATNYDEYYETFEGAIENYIDWQLLKEYLPRDKKALILDAAGGTGRIALPLAKRGYSVTLCDISPGMIERARLKLLSENIMKRVDLIECDVSKLCFADESFDFTLCWGATIDAVKELIRVTKNGGKISIFLANKCRAAIQRFRQDPSSAISALKSKYYFVYDHGERHVAVGVEDANELFEKEGIKVNDIYAVCGMLEFLSIPEEVRKSRTWDDNFFKQVTEILLRLSKEPSAKGLSRHLVLYGEKVLENRR
jgi:ubiquinone/menaquinone biosynthesis C-methylase UbiE